MNFIWSLAVIVWGILVFNLFVYVYDGKALAAEIESHLRDNSYGESHDNFEIVRKKDDSYSTITYKNLSRDTCNGAINALNDDLKDHVIDNCDNSWLNGSSFTIVFQ